MPLTERQRCRVSNPVRRVRFPRGTLFFTAGSFNGRIRRFERRDAGSNPAPATESISHHLSANQFGRECGQPGAGPFRTKPYRFTNTETTSSDVSVSELVQITLPSRSSWSARHPVTVETVGSSPTGGAFAAKFAARYFGTVAQFGRGGWLRTSRLRVRISPVLIQGK